MLGGGDGSLWEVRGREVEGKQVGAANVISMLLPPVLC